MSDPNPGGRPSDWRPMIDRAAEAEAEPPDGAVHVITVEPAATALARRRRRRHQGMVLTAAAVLAAVGLVLLGSDRRIMRQVFPSAAGLYTDERAAATPRPTLPMATTIAAADAPESAARLVPPAAPATRVTVPGQFRQLTQGGCCPAAWWSEDSTEVRFIDRPEGAAGAAIYGVPLWPPGSAPRAVDTSYSLRAGQTSLIVRPAEDYSWVEDQTTGDRWQLPTGGNPVRLSPDGSRAVWWQADGGWSHHDTLVRAYGSDIYGYDLRELGSLWGMDVVSFLPDNKRVLVLGRPARNQPVYALATLDVSTGVMTQLTKSFWISEAALSPDGAYVVYMVSLDREHPDANGAWVVPTDGGEPSKLAFVGAYRWRDGHRLVYIPMLPGTGSDAVFETDVVTGATRLLIDPATSTVRVASNDWSISPDGATLVFLSEDDRNLWAVDLPR
jgi:hypothetical protein